MREATNLLERAGREAPQPRFDLEDIRRRRERRERARRIRAGALGMTIAVALIVGGVNVVGGLTGDTSRPLGGTGLPAAERAPEPLAPGEYAYQRILYYERCEEEGFAPEASCSKLRLRLGSWWALDDSGRIEVIENHGYGIHAEGTFGPGEFPDEGTSRRSRRSSRRSRPSSSSVQHLMAHPRGRTSRPRRACPWRRAFYGTPSATIWALPST